MKVISGFTIGKVVEIKISVIEKDFNIPDDLISIPRFQAMAKQLAIRSKLDESWHLCYISYVIEKPIVIYTFTWIQK